MGRRRLLQLLLALSGTAYTGMLLQTTVKVSFLVTLGAAFFLLLWLLLRWDLWEKCVCGRHWAVYLAAGGLAAAAVWTARSSFQSTGFLAKVAALLGLPAAAISWAAAAASLPMAFCYLTWFVSAAWACAVRFWNGSSFTERIFLLGAGIILSLMVCFSFFCTQAFYGARMGGRWFDFDLVYSADSGYLSRQDVFRVIGAGENDLRQPLFGVFSQPFALVAWLLSKALPFLPHGYLLLLQILELFLYLAALTLVGRLLHLQGAEEAVFLCLLCLTYPVLLFSLVVEQYLFAVFWLILLISTELEGRDGSVPYVAATGSMLTSGVFFPLVAWKGRPRDWVRRTALLAGQFFAVTTLSGRLTIFLELPTFFEKYAYYAGGGVSAGDKLLQYLNFVGACFVAPASRPDSTLYQHISYQMCPVTSVSVVGVALLVLCAVGAILTWRERFTRICAAWIGFSFLLLGVVGWGTIDNGLMLYTLYFSWAMAALAFSAVRRGLARWPAAKWTALAASAAALLLVNLPALRELLIFCTQYYPALGG